MADVKVWFGTIGGVDEWYLAGGPAGFTPIDISALPGPKPAFTPRTQVFQSFTAASWNNELIYNGRILANTSADGTQGFDAVKDWNFVKNIQLTSSSAQNVLIDGLVHADVAVGVTDTAASRIDLVGVKRANVITGLGDDTVSIKMVSDQGSIWVDDFRIATGAGNDVVKIDGLDIAAKIASGDPTYIQAYNKPGIPLVNDGAGRNAYVALGDGNDQFFGYSTNDHVIGGHDTGTVQEIMGNAPPSGFGYAVGGSTGKSGCDSILYKINLATGAATAVGEVKIGLGFLGSVGGLDVESLSLNPVDGQLYGFASKLGILDALVKIDPTTAKTTYIKLNCANWHAELQDMAFDTQGNLFFTANGDFLQVNTTTGAIKTIGNNTLPCKIGAMAIDPVSGKVYAIGETNGSDYLYEINKTTGKLVATSKLTGTDKCPAIEGMSFDSAGQLWAVDKESGGVFKIDTTAHTATKVSTTLTNAQQYGDGFEALAIQTTAPKVLVDLKAIGGDQITTAAGDDHIYYAAGDGVDRVTDFDAGHDTLHLIGITADHVKVDSFNGNSFIHFTDANGAIVSNALIELDGVAQFDASKIVYGAPDWW